MERGVTDGSEGFKERQSGKWSHAVPLLGKVPIRTNPLGIMLTE